MAPKMAKDDFILTIDSEDEAQVALRAGEASDNGDSTGSETTKKSATDGGSRKRKALSRSAIKIPDSQHISKKQRKGSLKGLVEDSSSDNEDDVKAAPGWADRGGQVDRALNPDFEFQLEQDVGVFDDFDAWDNGNEKEDERKKGVDMEALIARKRNKSTRHTADTGIDVTVNGNRRTKSTNADSADRSADSDAQDEKPKMTAMLDLESEDEPEFGKAVELGEGGESEDGEPESFDSDDAEDSDVADDMDADHEYDKHDSDASDDEEDQEEKARQDAFFAPQEQSQAQFNGTSATFQSMKLSRPILRGLTAVGFSHPTPIQAKTIPIALLGKDVVGGAVTGSGKTGAFMIPILERLLFRDRKVPTSRVAVLMPTRELAVQCFNVATKLASFTDITFCQLVGGFSLREQENILKKRPDVIIATPGRFIDHMRNSASFTIDTLEILVLDEADRMLEEGFSDELNEILATIPRSRQTMLFSATMTNNVDKLIRVGLDKPVRLMVDAKKQTVGTLTQEFVRLRQGREDKRLAYLLCLCSTVFEQRCIIFFRQKKEAHRVRIVFGLFGFKVAELHGSMSQEQRIESVEAFRAGKVTHLLATDVASRGLDIKGVEAVINYEAPQSHEIYLHRVGRTARAGRSGRACTLAAEPDRKVVRAAVKTGKSQGAKIVSRVLEPKLVDEWAEKVDAVEGDVHDLLKEEREERQLQSAEMQMRKGENMLAHQKEIMSRPKRDWFQTEKEKLAAKKAGAAEMNGALSSKKRKAKLSNKDKKRLDATKDRKEGRMWKKGKDERGLHGVKNNKVKKKSKK